MNRFIIYIGISVLFLVILFEGSFNLFPWGLFSILGITILSGVLSIKSRVTTKNKKYLVNHMSVLIIGIITIIIFFVIGRFQYQIIDRNANLIITKIEEYKVNNDKYPINLDLLEPKYFKKVPKVRVGIFPKTFEYEYANGKGHESKYDYKLNYQLHYYLIGYDGYIGTWSSYNSIKNTWHDED